MTAKEKAEELVNRIMNTFYKTQEFVWKSTAKQCALIAVDELIEEENKYNNGSFYPSKYWEEVKQEIELL